MPKFAIVENGVVLNTVLAEPDYATTQGWIALPDDMTIGCLFDGNTWFNPENTPEKIKDKQASAARQKRDFLLNQTDWTQSADVPQPIKDKWALYRQALRDVPQQAGFPENIIWPTKPV